ncbi:hypothetical protein GGI07_005040 [Coemansia sp. Benny D115]|nr:hypothetical protein GGI07_005040 [Coemansia sp. Benny D115]
MSLIRNVRMDVLNHQLQTTDAQVFLAALRADDVTVDQLASLVAGRVVRDSENTLAVEERARGMVRQMLAKEDPVYRVIEQRVRRFLLVQLDRNEGPADLARRVSGGQGAVEVKAALKAAGLEGVQGAMLQLLSRMAQLCWLNWQVYQEWYSKIRA